MSGFGLARSPDDDKFQELVLYICRRSDGDKRFGATKLNKLLFYCDFLAYRQFGEAITWHAYQRLEHGPAPKQIVPLLKRMEKRGDVAFAEVNYHGHIQKRAYALREPNLSRFSGDEIALVDELIDVCWGKSATQISEMSHEFRGWKLASDGEIIPYELALVNFRKPTERQLAQGAEMAKELRSRQRELSGDEG